MNVIHIEDYIIAQDEIGFIHWRDEDNELQIYLKSGEVVYINQPNNPEWKAKDVYQSILNALFGKAPTAEKPIEKPEEEILYESVPEDLGQRTIRLEDGSIQTISIANWLPAYLLTSEDLEEMYNDWVKKKKGMQK